MTEQIIRHGVEFTPEERDALKGVRITYADQRPGQSDDDYERQCALGDRDTAREYLREAAAPISAPTVKQKLPFWRSTGFAITLIITSVIGTFLMQFAGS